MHIYFLPDIEIFKSPFEAEVIQGSLFDALKDCKARIYYSDRRAGRIIECETEPAILRLLLAGISIKKIEE